MLRRFLLTAVILGILTVVLVLPSNFSNGIQLGNIAYARYLEETECTDKDSNVFTCAWALCDWSDAAGMTVCNGPTCRPGFIEERGLYACKPIHHNLPEEDEDEEKESTPQQVDKSCNYDVPNPPEFIPQHQACNSVNCWAAATTMMLSYRDGISYPTIDEALKSLGPYYYESLRWVNSENLKITSREWTQLIRAIGLDPLPDIYFPQDFKRALETYGIILAVYPPEGSASRILHAALLISIGGQDCEDPVVLTIDPMSTDEGGHNFMPYSEFKSKFYSKPSSELYVLSSRQNLQSEDIFEDNSQPVPDTGVSQDSDLKDDVTKDDELTEEEELREEIEGSDSSFGPQN